MQRSVRDRLAFYRQVLWRYHTTGAVAPSSRFLARALTRPLARRAGPVRVLEVGPGSGSVTRAIIPLLEPGDRLDLVEINVELADVVRRRFEVDSRFRPAAELAEVHGVPLQEYDSPTPYDYVISSLPLNNFSAELVEELYESYFRLLTPGGMLSYFEYIGMRPLRRLFTGQADRERVRRISEIMAGYHERHRVATSCVLVNVPPARVQHLRAADDSTGNPTPG